jgi:hypothetical protein
VRKALKFVLAEKVEDVLNAALAPEKRKRKKETSNPQSIGFSH